MVLKRKVAALEKIDADFGNLQNKIRRDPRSYKDDFLKQWQQYEAQKEIFLVSPSSATGQSVTAFHDIVDLIAHVADCYPEDTRTFPGDLTAILTQHHATLYSDLREKLVGSLVLLRNKDVIDSATLLTTLFPILVSSPSKSLRAVLFQKITMDLRNANNKHTNHPLNRTIQTVLHNLVVADRTSPRALWAVKLTRELWKRQIWNDAKVVEVMKEAALSECEKVVIGSVRFFLGGDKEREEQQEDESSDDETPDLKKVKHQGLVNKKSKKNKKAYDKAKEKITRHEKKKVKAHPLNFSALHLLHDPQSFAEALFDKHLKNTRNKISMDTRLLVLQLITRLVGLHKLTLIQLYSWFHKYLTPKTANVTSILASLAQGMHNLVPPESIEPLIQKIANEFVSEASSGEVCAAGLNAIREICFRQPLAMSDTLLQDLVQYKKSKDKGTMMAAKGLLSLYREVGAEMLRKKDRGKDATIGLKTGEVKQMKFGEQEVGGIEGLELLEKWKAEQKKIKEANAGEKKEGEEGEGGEEWNEEDWEAASVDSDDSGGWIDVVHDDDEPAPKKRRTSDVEGEAPAPSEELKSLSILATTTVLTPADLLKLEELRTEHKIETELQGRKTQRQKEREARHLDEGLTAEQIEAPARLRKTTKEERRAMAAEGKPGREEHKSTQAIRRSKKEAEGKSTTNKEKAREKNFMMTLGKAKAKKKRKLVETRRVLKSHVERSKRGGRNKNGLTGSY